MKITKTWVLIKHNNGKIEAWRDYDTTWGSPIYTVLGYVTGTHRDAMRLLKQMERDKVNV